MTTPRQRGCCSGPPPKITYVKIKGNSVGMTGVEEAFERLYQAGRPDDDALQRELVEQARVYNYIAPGSEDAYGWALRMAYRAYVRSSETGDRRPWLPYTRP